MKSRNHFTIAPKQRLAWNGAALLALTLAASSQAYPVGRVTFGSDAPFAGGYASTLKADTAEDLFSVSGWADANATVPANLWNWWILLGVDSGTGNGALLDGTESMTVQLDKSAGAALLYFTYTGGNGSGDGNLARLSISGFSSDPGASAVLTGSAVNRITNLSYAAGTLTFDYLDDGGGADTGQLILAHPEATAGSNLKLTVAASPDGNATSAFAAMKGLDIQEAFGGPQVHPSSIPDNSTSIYNTADGKLTIATYSDANATTPANLGRYLDECFGLAGPNTVSGTSSMTLQFAADTGLARLDVRYSGGTLVISGFTADPQLVDPSSGTTGSSYDSGTLTVYIADGGAHPLYFQNRAASAGQTLLLTDADSQVGVGGIGYANLQTVLGPDIPNELAPTYTTPDSQVTLTGYSDTPGTSPAYLHENYNWFGVSGGNNTESVDGAESLGVQFNAGVGLSGLGTRYTTGQVIISGFISDPGFSDPSGTATNISYTAGTLSYTFNAPHSPEIVVAFTNIAASAGQTLSLHTDGSQDAQLTLTRINYATASAAPVVLSITPSAGDLVLAWPNGTLQQSPSLAGPFEDVIGATSPYTNHPAAPQQFFRVQVQP